MTTEQRRPYGPDDSDTAPVEEVSTPGCACPTEHLHEPTCAVARAVHAAFTAPTEKEGAALRAPGLTQVEEQIDRLLALGVSEAAVEPIRDWLRDRRASKPVTIAYFGTWKQAGHYWWEPGSFGPVRPRNTSSIEPIGPWGHVDGKLTPRWTAKQSSAALHHLDGWTALALHDYTVDSRGGSNAVFVMDTDLSFDLALRYAREAFPAVLHRIESRESVTLVGFTDPGPAKQRAASLVEPSSTAPGGDEGV